MASKRMGSGIINAKISKGAGGCSEAEVGELLAHDALPTLLADLPVDEAEDAVVHVHGAATREAVPFPLLKTQFLLYLFAEVLFFEFELWRELLRFEGSEWRVVYLGRGAFISLSSVAASKLYLEMVL